MIQVIITIAIVRSFTSVFSLIMSAKFTRFQFSFELQIEHALEKIIAVGIAFGS